MYRVLHTLGTVLGLLIAIPQATAAPTSQPATKGRQCFSIRSFENWKALDAKTLYIRVNLHQYYRLDLANSCPTLLSPNSHLITKWRGSSWVCSARDGDLKAGDDPMRGFASPWIVRTMKALTDKEAAAIPRKFKP